MEIITLLKANIRHRKGSFISIILLMIIISMALSAIISLKDNTSESIRSALKSVNSGDVVLFIGEDVYSGELESDVTGSEMVESVVAFPALMSGKTTFGDKIYENPWFLEKLRDDYRVFNEELTGYADTAQPLSDGEIYITLGIKCVLNCNIGDTVNINSVAGSRSFTVKGFIEEPSNGSFSMGWKQVFISDGDYDRMLEDFLAEPNGRSYLYEILHIYQSESCTLTHQQFLRQLNLDTGITNFAIGCLTIDQTEYYTLIYPEVITNVLTVFVFFLLVIVLIVMAHSITSSIEMDYVSLGVLKSLGFSSGKLRLITALQYLVAEIGGTVIGIIIAIPLTSFLGGVFQPLMAVLIDGGISILKVLLVITGVLVVSFLFILIATRKAAKVSPVRAISGGHDDVYFDSRFNVPVCMHTLTASLGLRQLTSSKKQYIGILVVVAILVFFMMSVMLLGNVISSDNVLESMGNISSDVSCDLKESVTEEKLDEIEANVRNITEISRSYYLNMLYVSLNGEDLWAGVHREPELVPGIIKGRAPLYDNEIVVTEILCDELGIGMGDTVTLGYQDMSAEFVISGCFQCTYDVGRTFALSLEGGRRIGVNSPSLIDFAIADKADVKLVIDYLNDNYGDILEASEVDDETYMSSYTIAIEAMRIIIYVTTLLFALVVVSMVCKKAFLKERTDIGVFKALGFTSGKLRLQFAFRFFFIALLGSILGSVLSFFFSGGMLTFLLRSVGITSLSLEFTPLTMLIPIGFICLCFFVFAFIFSRKIKSVEVRELVCE